MMTEGNQNSLSKEDIRDVIKEEIDTASTTFAQGVGKFSNDMALSVSNMINSFDDFFTTNLSDKNPKIAELFLENRIQNMKKIKEEMEHKISDLEKRKANLKC